MSKGNDFKKRGIKYKRGSDWIRLPAVPFFCMVALLLIMFCGLEKLYVSYYTFFES